MIARDQLTHAVRQADRDVENHPGGIPAWCAKYEIVSEDLLYVASQRGLRAAMVVDGQDPTNRTTTLVSLGPTALRVQPILTAAWLDGFAGGFTVKMSRLPTVTDR